MAYSYQVVVSIKNDKHEEKSFSNNPLSKVRYGVSRSCLCQPQLATCGQLINLALFKWPQIWHKLHSHMPNDVCTMPCQFGLKFSENSCKNSNLRVPLICETHRSTVPKSPLGIMWSMWWCDGCKYSNLRDPFVKHRWVVSKSPFSIMWTTWWCDGTSLFDHKTPYGHHLKVSYTIHKQL